MMVQKALSAKSLSDAQGATILTGWIKILPVFLIVVPGMISRVLYPDEVRCGKVIIRSCLALSSSSQRQCLQPRGQGSHVLPHGPYCLAP